MYIKVQAPPSLAAREARNAPRGAKKTVIYNHNSNYI